MISHTPAIHKQVDAFLSQIKEAMPNTPTPSPNWQTPSNQGVVPATYSVVPRMMQMVRGQVPGTPPPPPQRMPRTGSESRPKHRFQFSVFYEGDGLIDDNVVELIKAQAGVPSTPIPAVSGAVTGASCSNGACISIPGIVQQAGMTLPSPHYTNHPPQYFPPDQPLPLAPGIAQPVQPATYPPQPARPMMPKANSPRVN